MSSSSSTASQGTPQARTPKSILKKSKRAMRDQSISLGTLMADGLGTGSREKRMMSSFSNLSQGSLTKLRKSVTMKKQMSKDGIQFSDHVDVVRISFMSNSVADACFWTDEELADFRHEAFMEECGLNAEDFD